MCGICEKWLPRRPRLTAAVHTNVFSTILRMDAAAAKPYSDQLSADRREHASAVFRTLDLKRAGSFDPRLLQMLCEKASHPQLAQRTQDDSRSARR